jgi:hypothetical protein
MIYQFLLHPFCVAHFVDAPLPGGDSMEKVRWQQQQQEQPKEKLEEGKPANTKKRVALTLIGPLISSCDRKLSKIDPVVPVAQQTLGPCLSNIAESQTRKDEDSHSRSMTT